MPSSVSVGEFGPLIAGRTFIVAEIGINHNGDLDLVRRLIAAAASAGCDAVKFQKRTVDVVYTPEELARPRANPFGPTNGDLKLGLELGREAYEQIEACCEAHQIQWSASCWDTGSVDFIAEFDPAFMKIASASLTDDGLLRHYRRTGKPLFLSTGMSTLAEMDHAVDVLGTEDLVLLHCTSAYPASHAEINLRCMGALRERYGLPVGYSGHERADRSDAGSRCTWCLCDRATRDPGSKPLGLGSSCLDRDSGADPVGTGGPSGRGVTRRRYKTGLPERGVSQGEAAPGPRDAVGAGCARARCAGLRRRQPCRPGRRRGRDRRSWAAGGT